MMYPPRAEERVTENKIAEFPCVDWVAQPKLNGTALIIICLFGKVIIMNRHGKIYAIKISVEELMSIFPKSQNWIICGEYLNKAQADETGEPLRDKFIIWDIINYDGEDLIGMTFEDRVKLLNKSVKKGKKSTRPYLDKELTDNISIIRTFDKQFDKAFELSNIPVIEGLVLKRRKAELKPCTRPDNNTGWQVKVRKSTKCYKF